MLKMKNYVVVIILTALMVGCGKKQDVVEEKALIPVDITLTEKGNIYRTEIYTGQIIPLKEVEVVSKSVGEVKEVYFDIGDQVKEGEVLFVLDKKSVQNSIKSLESQIQSTQAAVDIASTELKVAEGSQKENQINQAKSSLDREKLKYKDAKKEYEDTKILYANKSVSKREMDQKMTAYEQSKISYETAKKAYDVLVEKTLNEDIDTAEARLNQAIANRNNLQIQLENTKDTLDDLEVKSPIDGIVSAKNIENGEMTSAGVSPYTIVDMDPVCVNINVSEKLVNKIKTGESIDVSVTAVKEEPFIGIIKNVSPVADKMTMTYPVKIEIQNKEKSIKPGMFAEVLMQLEKNQDVIVLPRNILELDEGQWFVYTVKDNIVHKKLVDIGIDNGREIGITSGLNEGEQVIVKGKEYVKEGQEVIISK